MRKTQLVGWFCEIPRDIRDKFNELYPGRNNKKILTLTAIKFAISKHPKSLYNLYKGAPDVATPSNDVKRNSSDDPRGEEDGS